MTTIKNFIINNTDNSIIISVNPDLFPLHVIYLAAHDFINSFYVVIDGNPNEQILVQFQKKDNTKDIPLIDQGYNFNQKLISYAVYWEKSLLNQSIRTAIAELALFGNSEEINTKNNFCTNSSELENINQSNSSYLDDPENITKEWQQP